MAIEVLELDDVLLEVLDSVEVSDGIAFSLADCTLPKNNNIEININFIYKMDFLVSSK